MNKLTIGTLVLDSPVLLAPMCGFFDYPFRAGVRAFGGAGLTYTEMVNPRGLLGDSPHYKTLQIVTAGPDDRPLASQIYGTDPPLLRDGAQWLEAKGFVLVDINMGCTKYKVTRRGAGTALLKNPDLAIALVSAAVSAVKIPVTVKIRYTQDGSWLDLARRLVDAGAAAITLHARTPGDKFGGRADWNKVRELVEAVPTVPVIGNGDIRSPRFALQMMAASGCAGIMVGRAVCKKPWLLRDINAALEGRPRPLLPSTSEMQAFRDGHYKRLQDLYGEPCAGNHFRKWEAQYVKWIARMDELNEILAQEKYDAEADRNSRAKTPRR